MQLVERVAAIEQHLRQTWIQREQLVVGGERLRKTAHLAKRIGAAEESPRRIGIERQNFVERGERLMLSPRRLQRAAEIVVRVRRPRTELYRLIQNTFRGRKIAALIMQISQQLQGSDVPGIQSENVVIDARRVREIACLMQAPRVLQQMVAHLDAPTVKPAGASPR